MAEYFKTVIAAVICVSFICGILPKEGAGKYAGLVAGIFVIAIVVSPLFQLSDTVSLRLSELQTQELAISNEAYLAEEFETTLAARIQDKLNAETGLVFDVAVRSQTDKEGNVTGVETVEITPFSAQYAKIAADYIEISIDRVVEKQ